MSEKKPKDPPKPREPKIINESKKPQRPTSGKEKRKK